MGFPELTNQLIHTWFNPVLLKQQPIYPEPCRLPGTCYFCSWPNPTGAKLSIYFSSSQGSQTTSVLAN